jgi:hypothetical protein
VRVKVYHSTYGCETGCCGHVIELIGEKPGYARQSKFEFDHPWEQAETKEQWARDVAAEVINANWPECLEDIDWSTLDIEDVREDC